MKALVTLQEKLDKQNLNKWINKLIFAIEFLMSIIFTYSMYKIVIYKSYENIWNLKYILTLVPSGIIVLLSIIWNCRVNKEKLEKILISFLIPVGMLYIFFIPPSYVPDEHAHIWKALEISQGKLITEIQEDGSTEELIPRFFDEKRIPYMGNYGQFNAASYEETDYKDMVEVQNPAQAYPAVLYLASSIGFFLGRIFGINGIITIYIAKLLNFIVFLVLGYYSIKIIPFGKTIIGIILFLPMTLQQAASISADSILNSISIFYICYTLYLLKREEGLKVIDKIAYIIMSIIIAVSKIAYVPIAGLSLLFIGNKNIKNKEKAIFISVTIILSIIIGLCWFVFMQQYPPTDSVKIFNETNNVNLKEQLINIIKDPIIFVEVIKNSILNSLYLDTMIGSSMGWLNINTSKIVINIFIMLLAISPFLDKNEKELKTKEKIWSLLVFAGVYILIILAAYLSWTTVGIDTVMGVQGRYFLPICALPLLCVCNKEKYLKFKNINIILPIICVILNFITIIDIIKFYV